MKTQAQRKPNVSITSIVKIGASRSAKEMLRALHGAEKPTAA